MRVKLLPSTFGCTGYPNPEQRLTSFLLDDCVCIDAGSIALALNDAERQRVRDIIITHAHIDHVASLPIFVDDLAPLLEEPIRVHATHEVIETIERDILNGTIYPRFSLLSTERCRLMEYVPFEPHKEFAVRHLRFTAIPVNHTIPTVGLLVTSANSNDRVCTVAFTSDTGETEEFWHATNRCARLDALIIEASFPNYMHDLARVTGHLTPSTLAAELGKLDHSEMDVLAVHLKPMLRDAVVEELAALDLPRLSVMQPGRTYEW